MCDCVGCELRLKRREMLEEQSRKVTILTEREQVLLMEGINVGLCIVLDDAVGDDDRTTLICGSDSVQRETAGETGNGAEKTLKSLGEVVRNVVLVHLS